MAAGESTTVLAWVDMDRENFADELARIVGTADARIVEAFREVDRADFLDGFYVFEAGALSWLAADRRPLPPEVARRIYSGDVLVTRIGSDGMATSSSSMPALMMAMLDALGAAPGMRVLEIGAATGYNAALLGRIVGPTGQVVSIEVDDELARLAAARFDPAGPITVVRGDGALGHPERAPYQRIIATVGCPVVPDAWRDQLAPGGRVLVPLTHGAAHPLTELCAGSGGWVGRYVGHASFMSAAGPVLGRDEIPTERLPPENRVVSEVLDGDPRRIDDLAFYLALDVPGAGVRQLAGAGLRGGLVRGLGVPGAVVSGRTLYWAEGGGEPGAAALRDGIRRWRELGAPGLDRYALELSAGDGGVGPAPAGTRWSWTLGRGGAEQRVDLLSG